MDLIIIQLILPFLFGVIIGSFLNVVALRFNTGVGIGGRSKCMSCGMTLTWKELIPVISYVIQGGKCKTCGSKISPQYPLVEILTGILFALIVYFFPPLSGERGIVTVLYLIEAGLLVAMTVYDIKHKILPDRFVYTFDVLALIGLFVGGSSLLHVPSLYALLAGPILALPFALLWVISRGRWMGLGDAKLVLGIGWILGISAGLNALILAFWIAAVISVIWLLITYKRFRPRTEIPFGPYLILGMYLVLFFSLQVLDVSLLKDILSSYM
jgi:leader peptidase (prepilin peptidase) / N-methyltransferase